MRDRQTETDRVIERQTHRERQRDRHTDRQTMSDMVQHITAAFKLTTTI